METNPNILLIRLKSIGDIVFTLPAVNRVRDHFPSARITFLTSRENGALVSGFTAADEIITVDRAAFRRWNAGGILANTLGLVRRLHRARFDLVVDFQGYGETGWLTWLTRAPQRWGSVYRRGRGWAYTRGVWRDDRIHPADWNLSLLEQCGLRTGPVRNEFVLPAGALDEARKFFAANRLDAARPALYLQPFTSSPPKNWPLEKYLGLARFWRERGVQIILSGGPGDRSRLERAQAEGFIVAAGVPRLTDVGLMKLSTLVIGGDTGFLHLAVALGKRVLMLIGRIGPGAAIPFGHADWVVAPPDGSALEQVELDRVLKASTAAFAEGGSP